MNIVKGISTKKIRKKAGFSLAEMLIVIAILGILAGFVGVGAVTMYKNIKQTQLDKTAETIFHAAQDRLSELYAYGKESTIDTTANANEIDATRTANSIFLIRSDVSKPANVSIMGDEAVSGEIYNNLWAIEYQASTCRVLNVVYADNSRSGLGGFGGGINADAAMDTMVKALSTHKFENRKADNYGWYGEEKPILQGDKQVGNTSVDVDIINEENLYAHARLSIGWEDELTEGNARAFVTNSKVTLTLMDADNAGTPSDIITIKGEDLLNSGGIENYKGLYNAKSDGDNTGEHAAGYLGEKCFIVSFDILLDSLKDGSFAAGSKETIFNKYTTGVTPGDNFYLIAKLEPTGDNIGKLPTVQDYDVDNSLFAGLSAGDSIAYIEYGRHLQNISKAEIDGLTAVQIADINFNSRASYTRDDFDIDDDDFNEKNDEFNKYWCSIYPNDPDNDTGFTDYHPGNSAKLKSYDGQYHIIQNLKINNVVESTTNSGIFGVLSYADEAIKIQNLIISNSKVSADSATVAGMFAASAIGSAGVSVENCYLYDVTVDGSDSATSLGGFIGAVSWDVTAKDCALASVNVGSSSVTTDSGAFIGNIAGGFKGEGLYVYGGTVDASTNAGGLIGYSTAANMTISGCRLSGTNINASSGNAGGIVGYAKNGPVKIEKDSTVAGCIIRASSGNAGGFIGNAVGAITIEDSSCYMPASSESNDTAGRVRKEFIAVFDPTANIATDYIEAADDSNVLLVSYGKINSLGKFEFVDELNTDPVKNLKWISGTSYAGGLVGYASSTVTVNNSFAAGVLSASANAGGFVGKTDGNLTVTGSYTDFYISGNRVGGFAAECKPGSTFTSCYTAGFLVGDAGLAAGFTPSEVTSISNSYSVFNFDDVSAFTGTAEQDPPDKVPQEYNINLYGNVANYPTDSTHNGKYFPIAEKFDGRAYYVYTDTFVEDVDNAVCVTASDLAENKNYTLLSSGSFVNGKGEGNTAPYSLASFFGTILDKYPFPMLKDTRVYDDASVHVLKHYNDWLIKDKTGIEVWYLLYNDSFNSLKTDVSRVPYGMMKFTSAEAVEVEKTQVIGGQTKTSTEYQIYVGNREVFSGYKFVGYFDPTSATAPLLDSSKEFDRTKKLDYIKADNPKIAPSMKKKLQEGGGKVVQTSIDSLNNYEVKGTDNSSIFEETFYPYAGGNAEAYPKTKRIYAVYRYNQPYTVTVSCMEYEFPKDPKATTETRDLLTEIYNGLRLDTAKYEVAYKEARRPNDLDADEEYTEDYIAEKKLYDQYKSGAITSARYKEELNSLYRDRALVNQDISVKIRKFTEEYYDYFDINNNDYTDQLVSGNVISTGYLNYIRDESNHIFSVVKIDPTTKNFDGEDINPADRCEKVTVNEIADYDNKSDEFKNEYYNKQFTMSTEKAYNYVILYASNGARQKLRLVFRNTKTDEEETAEQIVNTKAAIDSALKDKTYSSKIDDTYTLRVSTKGFEDPNNKISLDTLMEESGYPEFEGFYRDKAIVSTADGAKSVTLYYTRKTHKVYFGLNRTIFEDNTKEYYKGNESREAVEVAYRDTYQQLLWELTKTQEVRFSDIDSWTSTENTIKNGKDFTLYTYKGSGNTSKRKNYNYNCTVSTYAELTGQLSQLTPGWIYLEFKEGWISHSFSCKFSIKESGDQEYAFKRNGYILSGFKIYYKNGADWVEGDDKETVTAAKTLYMPDTDVMVVPEWRKTPKELRLEIYYQSAYDKVLVEDPKNKIYEYGGSKTYDVRSSGTVYVKNSNTPVSANLENMTISELMTSVSDDGGGLSNYLVPYFKNGYFERRKDHYLSGNFIPYTVNSDNTKRFGYPHYAGNDVMVVALYFDRITVKYNFHYTNQDFTSGNYTIKSQWDALKAASPLFATDYPEGTDKKALSDELNNPSGKPESIGDHAIVTVTKHDQSHPSYDPSSDVTYGGVDSSGAYGNPTSVPPGFSYGITLTYEGLYGGPTVFSSDNTSLYPTWYYEENEVYKPASEYRIDGTKGYYNDYSLQFFTYMSEDAMQTEYHLIPNYPEANLGYIVLYKEASPSDASYSVSKHREDDLTKPVSIAMFDQSKREYATKVKTTNSEVPIVIKKDNTLTFRTFIDGYQTCGYVTDNENIAKVEDIPVKTSYTSVPDNSGELSVGSRNKNVYLFLKRRSYTISFINSDVAQKTYLYRQKIDKLPGAADLPEDPNYVFDGWFTTSAYNDSDRVTDSDGKITDEYKALKNTITDETDNTLLMNCQNLQLFAHWSPKECTVEYNPFFPDMLPYQVDSRITVDYGEKIEELPIIDSLPETDAFANHLIEKDGNDIYYVKKIGSSVIFKYKFAGWYKCKGLIEPSSMNDLDIEFVANESKITGDTTLYAKWVEEGTSIYTIICADYTDNGKELMTIYRSGTAGDTTTVYPPTANESEQYTQYDEGEYDYSVLEGYEAISPEKQITVQGGRILTFYYRPINSWSFTIYNCIKDQDGNDIVISTVPGASTYNQVQVAASDIPGYQIYEYQIGDTVEPKTNTSDFIPLIKPDTGSAEIIVRYTLNDGIISAKSGTVNYYKHERVNLVAYNSAYPDALKWTGNYKPAILYEINTQDPQRIYEYITTSEEDVTDDVRAVNDAVDAWFSKLSSGENTVTLKLAAVNSETLEYSVIKDIGSKSFNVIESTFKVTFRGRTDAGQSLLTGDIYCKSKGEDTNTGKWFWDADLKHPIGSNGTNIVEYDTAELDGSVQSNAEIVQTIINSAKYTTDSGVVNKQFYVTERDSKAYIIVDDNRMLCNGDKLTADRDAYVQAVEGDENVIPIVLYSSNNVIIGEINVILPQ